MYSSWQSNETGKLPKSLVCFDEVNRWPQNWVLRSFSAFLLPCYPRGFLKVRNHCISIVCEVLYFGLVLEFYCFLYSVSFVLRHLCSGTHEGALLYEQLASCRVGNPWTILQKKNPLVNFPPFFGVPSPFLVLRKVLLVSCLLCWCGYCFLSFKSCVLPHLVNTTSSTTRNWTKLAFQLWKFEIKFDIRV